MLKLYDGHLLFHHLNKVEYTFLFFQHIHHELLQIEKGIQEKNNQLSKLSFLRFLERRSLTADLEKLGQRKQKLLVLIQDIESMYNEQCNKERTEFSMIVAEKGL